MHALNMTGFQQMEVKFLICIALFPPFKIYLLRFYYSVSEFFISLLKAKYFCTVANYYLDLPLSGHTRDSYWP